jgi:serine protease inhibitor ecotin
MSPVLRYVRAITDDAHHEIKYGTTDLGHEISAKARMLSGCFTPKFGDTGNVRILGNRLEVLGLRAFRVVYTDFDIVNRPRSVMHAAPACNRE